MERPGARAALALACCLCYVPLCYSYVENPAQVNTTKHRILVLNLPDAVSHQFVFFKVRGTAWSFPGVCSNDKYLAMHSLEGVAGPVC